jgi:hypothetical protein
VFLAFEEVHDDGGAGWAELAQRLGLGGVADAHIALRRMRDEPLREAVAGLFGTRVAEEAFLPEAAADADSHSGADAARAQLSAAVQRVASAVGFEDDTVSIAYEMAKLASSARGVRPRLVAQAVAGWTIFSAVGDVACDSDPGRVTRAFDEWDAAAAVGDLARRSGSGDAQAWRAVELARALLATPTGALRLAVVEPGLPWHWLEDAAIRAAAGWNEWDGTVYVNREAWDELVDSIAGRDALLDADGVLDAAAELKRRAAAAGYAVHAASAAQGRTVT